MRKIVDLKVQMLYNLVDYHKYLSSICFLGLVFNKCEPVPN